MLSIFESPGKNEQIFLVSSALTIHKTSMETFNKVVLVSNVFVDMHTLTDFEFQATVTADSYRTLLEISFTSKF
jgi:hypothetical protein